MLIPHTLPKDISAVYPSDRLYAWPPPSLSLLYFLCWASPWPMLRWMTVENQNQYILISVHLFEEY